MPVLARAGEGQVIAQGAGIGDRGLPYTDGFYSCDVPGSQFLPSYGSLSVGKGT